MSNRPIQHNLPLGQSLHPQQQIRQQHSQERLPSVQTPQQQQPKIYRNALPGQRLAEIIEALKTESENLMEVVNIYKAHKDDYEIKLNTQLQELTGLQQGLTDLERVSVKFKQQYEEEIVRLRMDLDQARQQLRHHNIQYIPASSNSNQPQHASASNSIPKLNNGGPASSLNDQGRRNSSMFAGNNIHERPNLGTTEHPAKRFKEDSNLPPATPSQQQHQKSHNIPNDEQQHRSDMRYQPPQQHHIHPQHQHQQQQQQQQHVHQQQHHQQHSNHEDLVQPHINSQAQMQAVNQQPVTGECILSGDNSPEKYKQEGEDWFAVYNPNITALADAKVSLDLLHTCIHDSVVCCVKFSNCGKYLATGCNHIAIIYDVQTGEKLSVLGSIPKPILDEKGEVKEEPTDLYIRSVVFSPDGKSLATGAEDRTIRVWDIQKRKVTHTFLGHEQEIYSLDWSRDSRILVSGSGDKCVKVWDLETGQLALTMSNPDDKTMPPLQPNEIVKDSGVTGVAVNPLNTRCVAAGSLDRMVRVWDTRTGFLLERFEGHQDSVYSVAFSPDGRSIVSGALDQTLKIWDLSLSTLDFLARTSTNPDHPSPRPLVTKVCRHTFSGHRDFVLSVAFIGTNGTFGRVDRKGDPVAVKGGEALAEIEWVVSGSKDWTVTFWDARADSKNSGQPLVKANAAQFMLQGHVNSVISVSLSPNGGLFATGAGDRKARIWRVHCGEMGAPAGPSNPPTPSLSKQLEKNGNTHQNSTSFHKDRISSPTEGPKQQQHQINNQQSSGIKLPAPPKNDSVQVKNLGGPGDKSKRNISGINNETIKNSNPSGSGQRQGSLPPTGTVLTQNTTPPPQAPNALAQRAVNPPISATPPPMAPVNNVNLSNKSISNNLEEPTQQVLSLPDNMEV
ncbi:general transcription repressor [Lobulomyces angularis]|nr:general transcription repressor [Lobulomyces angularis]